MDETDRTLVFFAVWAVLGVASGVFMWRAAPDTKRAWFPRLTVASGIVFIGFAYWIMPHAHILYFMVPAVALITYLNLKFTKLCAQCGTYHQSFPPFYKISFCRKCGKELA